MTTSKPFTENNLHHIFDLAGDEFILLETAKITEDEHQSYLFTAATQQLCHYSGDDPLLFLQKCAAILDSGLYLAGWLSYEFGYELEESLQRQIPCQKGTLLAEFGVYESCRVFDHRTDLHLAKAKTPPLDSSPITNITLSQTENTYIKQIKKIQEYILAGDTYQVNYTLKLLFDFIGKHEALYLNLRRNQQVSFAAFIKQKNNSIMSFSPELFFKKEAQTITVRPMKGTIGRGCTRAEDKKNSLFLQTDLKSLAENVMIVDLLRNDLGRIAQKGKVHPTSLFDVEVYNSLLQMTSTIKAETPKDLGLQELFKALFPCGSVTGAPKIRTMEIIRELEDEPRGVYTGAIGFLGPQGQASFNVPIRTVVLNGSKGKMGIGSGIVADSDPMQEWQECLLKGEFLTKAKQPFELIETLLWQPESGLAFATEHGKRLMKSAQYFNYVFDPQRYTDILQAEETKLYETSRVRLTLNKEGQFTIHTTPCPPPAPFTPKPDTTTQQKVCLSLSKRSSTDPFLYHKTTNRKRYNDTWHQATKAGFLDALFCNERDEVTEGCISNIFVLKDGLLLTPPISAGLLPGVFRQYLLINFPNQVKEKTLYKTDILDKKNILCIGNSVRGLITVKLKPEWLI